MLTDQDRHYCENVLVAGTHQSKFGTFDVVERLIADGVEGDFAEAGVMAGGQIAVMDYVLRKYGKSRKIHAFDSFDGIPQATSDDDADTQKVYGVRKPGEPMKSTGVSRVDLDGFWYFMKQWEVRCENVSACKGWFQETLHLWKPSPLALLRIDVDLVESVVLCLKYLYPHVVHGGYVIFDDYYVDVGTAIPPNRLALFNMTGLGSKDFTHVPGSEGTVWWKKG